MFCVNQFNSEEKKFSLGRYIKSITKVNDSMNHDSWYIISYFARVSSNETSHLSILKNLGNVSLNDTSTSAIFLCFILA